MNKTGFSALVFGGALLAGSAAWSLTLTGNFGSNEWDNFDIPAGYTNDTDANAGLLSLTATYGDGSTGHLDAFCIDLRQPFLQGKDYSFTTTPFVSAGAVLSDAQITDIRNLFEVANPGQLDFGTEEHSSGLNLALWEIVYETSGSYSVDDTDGGNFWTLANASDSGELAAVAFANDILAKIVPGVARTSYSYNVRFLESDDHASQNLVTFAPVPLPAAGWAFLSALGALALVRRRGGSA